MSIAARAEKWLEAALWLVIVFASLQILMFAHGRDQGIYSVVGEGVMRGRMPYRAVWDFKPPAIFFVFAFAQALFGKAMVSVRIVEVAGLVGSVFAMRRITRNVMGTTVPGLMGGALAALDHAEMEFWHSGQPEHFGGMLTVFALALVSGSAVTADRKSSRITAWACAGALVGVAFLFKPPLGGAAFPCALYLGITEWKREKRLSAAIAPTLVLGVASVVPIVLCGAWFAVRLSWSELYWTLFEFTPGYTRLGWTDTMSNLYLKGAGEALTHFSYAIPAGMALVVLPALAPRERGLVALVLGVVAVHVAGIAMQAKFFAYHYGATLPLMAFVAGIGFYKLWRLLFRIPVVAPVLAAAYVAGIGGLVAMKDVVPDVPGTFWARSIERLEFLFTRYETREQLDQRLYHVADYDIEIDRAAARKIAAITSPADTIYIWGFEPIVYWFAERRAASRFIYNVPQRAAWDRDRSRSDLMRDLARNSPRVVLVQHGDYFRFVTGDDYDSAGALATFPELDQLLREGYRKLDPIADLELYVRN